MGKYKVGFFPGNWDLLHPGHIMALREAEKYCDYLIVGIKGSNKDKPNKNEPILDYKDRRLIIEAIKYVDEAFYYFDEKTLYKLDETGELPPLKKEYYEHAELIRFMGIDHKPHKHKIKAKVIYISRDHNYSSSDIRRRIIESEK